MSHYFNGALKGTKASNDIFTYSGATRFGRNDLGLPAVGLDILAAGGGNYAPSGAELLAHQEAIKATGAFVPIPGQTDRIWTADDTGLVMVESLAGDNAVAAGAPLTVQSVAYPDIVWGW